MPREALGDSKLADIAFKDTVLEMNNGKHIWVTPEHCLGILKDLTKDAQVTAFYEKERILADVGKSPTVKLLAREGIIFENSTTTSEGFKENLIQLWERFRELPKKSQEFYVQNLIAWAAGEGDCPQLG